MPTNREIASFEAGIKLGALYHRFVGSPVSPKTAGSLECAIEESISLQAYLRSVDVRIDRRMLEENASGYEELEGGMIFAEVEIDYRGETVRARLEYDPDKGYPMTKLI
ncbi:MAG: dihydroneopterin aldolase family protein [Methanotrichaceae archaeon]